MEDSPQPAQEGLLSQYRPENLTSPTPRRIFSCERCTYRKQKCDKKLPICTPCQKARSACMGSAREANVVQGKDQEITRKGIVTTLLERIAELENEVQKRQISSDYQTSRTQPAGADVTPATETHEVISEHIESLDTDPVRSGPGMNINLLTLSAVAEPRNRAGEFLKHLSTPCLITGVTETFGGNPESTARVDSLWEGISQYIRHPAGATQRLHIPHDDAIKALDTYLDVVDFRFPRLPVEKVRSGIDAISANNNDEAAYSETLRRDPAHIFMAYIVVAIVPLVSDSYPISQGSCVSVHLLGKCLKLLSRVFRQEDGVDIIHCLHLLIILSIHCSAAGSAWHLVGFAMNKCIALGYHREDLRTRATLSASDIQQRRWAFWGCYLLDRLICAGLGRPFSIDDQDITVPLPGDESSSKTSHTCDGDGDSSTPSLTPMESSHVHLFRYAILLSSAAAQEAFGQGNVTESGAFDCLLGNALYWRTVMPTATGQNPGDIRSHRTSLFNTLMLRIAIREIEHGFVTTQDSDSLVGIEILQESNLPRTQAQGQIRHRLISTSYTSDQAQNTPPIDSFVISQLFACEQNRVRRINLLNTCRSVARSLDRTRMLGRPYLSFLTGYSALSMGLACLYYLVITAPSAAQGSNSAIPYSFPPSTAPRASTSSESALFANLTPPSSVHTQERFPSKEMQWRLQRSIYHDPQTIVDLACRKLDNVGRQFPRLEEYRVMLERLRNLVLMWPVRSQLGAEFHALQDEADELREVVKGIGPTHLRLLAGAVIYMLKLT